MIRKRLVFLFVLQIGFVLILSGIYLNYRLENVLEKELGKKLETSAAAIAIQLEPALVSRLVPGDEDTRTFKALLHNILKLKDATQIQHVFVFSNTGQIWLDTKKSTIGYSYPRYIFDKFEISRVQEGYLASSILFEGTHKKLYKTGYAPLKNKENVIGVVAVEGSAESLRSIRDIQKSILQIGLFSMLVSFFLALFTSKSITAPLQKLQAAAERIGHGKMNEPISVKGKDEIGFLAATMEKMRKGILQRDEQQKAMLAGVAHEIRNPLGGIELFAGLLHDELEDPEKKARTEKILKESKNLKTLIQNFLDYARPINPNPQPCHISESWKEVYDLLENQIHTKKVKVNFTGDAVIFLDAQHLKQIFLNLALNSIQAMNPNEKNEIFITVNTNNNKVTILFQDTGSGIPSDIQNMIFEPFFSSKASGLGLGLAIVKNLVEKNKGHITLKKTDSFHSCFELTFSVQN